jgi:hemolysin activation/secretion protein
MHAVKSRRSANRTATAVRASVPRLSALAAVLTTLGFGAPAVFAQQTPIVPNAGSTLRDTLQTLPPSLSPRSNSDIHVDEPNPASPSDSSLHFAVKAFQIDGNTAFSTARLIPLLAQTIGAERTLGDLDKAAARITDFYRAHGYLVARAYVPAQDIHDGVVDIAIVEGRYGEVHIHNRSHVRDAVLQHYLAPVHLGDVIDEHRLDRATLLIQDVTGASVVTGNLRAGEAPGVTDLSVEVPATPSITGSVQADNYGITTTGRYRVGGDLQWNSPLGFGDRLEARVLASITGQDFGHLGYSVPLGSDGLRTGIAFTDSTYRLGGQFSALDAYGHADVLSWNLAYPVIRSNTFDLNVDGGFDHKSLVDHADGTLDDKFNNVVGAGIDGDLLAPGTVGTYAMRVETGDLHFQSADALAADTASAHTAGRYTKFTYAFALYRSLTPQLQLHIALSGQQASKNLDSSEKFSLGGPYGVRAYPTGEAPGDDGYLANLELHYAFTQTLLPVQLGLFAFVDTGDVTINADPFAGGANHERLSGTGVGATLSGNHHYDLQLIYAHRLGDTVAVADTDSSWRIWLQLSKAF